VEEIREIIIAEAKAYLEKHPELREQEPGDKPRHSNHDIYAGKDGRISGGWFDVDDYFDSEVY